MEIKIGNCDNIIDDPKNVAEFSLLMYSVVEALFLISGIKKNEEQIEALSRNMHRFLVENKDFVIGLVNAGRMKKEKSKNNA